MSNLQLEHFMEQKSLLVEIHKSLLKPQEIIKKHEYSIYSLRSNVVNQTCHFFQINIRPQFIQKYTSTVHLEIYVHSSFRNIRQQFIQKYASTVHLEIYVHNSFRNKRPQSIQKYTSIQFHRVRQKHGKNPFNVLDIDVSVSWCTQSFWSMMS